MVERKVVEEVRADFSFLKGKVLGVLLFGSVCRGVGGKRDIDVCIVAPGCDPRKLLMEVFRRVNVGKKDYDVHVFEALPLYIKAEIIKNHVFLFGDFVKLYEYLYLYRKIWNDQKRRQELTKDEFIKILSD